MAVESREPEDIVEYLHRVAKRDGPARLSEAADEISRFRRMFADIQDQFRDHTGKLARLLRGMPIPR